MTKQVAELCWVFQEGLNLEGKGFKAIIGSEKHAFYIHEHLIRPNSAFFAAALSKNWTEAKAREVKLPEEDPDIFFSYLDWLYSGTLALKEQQDDHGYPHLARLYALGERIIAPALQNAVIDLMLDKSEKSNFFPTKASVRIIYDCTSARDPARRMLVDMHAFHGFRDWVSRDPDETHIEFLMDLAQKMLKRRDGGGVMAVPKSDYHKADH